MITKVAIVQAFNRNILYCKLEQYPINNTQYKDLIETFCIVNVGRINKSSNFKKI